MTQLKLIESGQFHTLNDLGDNRLAMMGLLQVGTQTITAEQLLPLITSYGMLPQLLREIIIDQAITEIACTPEEEDVARQQFYQSRQLATHEHRQAWAAKQGMTVPQLETLAVRSLKIEKYKHHTFGSKIESSFLQRKSQFDRVIYSLLCAANASIAQELYFRIQEGEESFADLARQYSQGPESKTGGLVGPVELQAIHPQLSQLLMTLKPGQLWYPTRIGDWVVVVRLEELLPAQLNEAMQRRLLDELFGNWLEQTIQKALQSLSSHHPQFSVPSPTVS